ncbi:MAG: RNA polymerase factor sigma-54 [Dysgonamonadaceae bacterium]|jgi:RNA polymerase sigma-54 factor|nr:RNA polymerase factor sigma-54 [Dysgonamonadaceae bacterium]
MIKQQLSQKLQQKLSPLQIQQIKMLELTSLELEDRINQEIEENPALEEGNDFDTAENEIDLPESDDYDPQADSDIDLSLGDYRTEDDIPDYKLQENNYSKDDDRREFIPYSEGESFQENLLGQLQLRNVSESELKIGEYLIGNIDEDGYLRRDLSAISDDLAFQYGMEVSVEEIQEVLKIIKALDPPGIAASDLQECLILQLKRKESTPERQCALCILTEYFQEFSKKHYEKILKTLEVTEEQLKDIIHEIVILNPKPGNAWDINLDSKLSQIMPDFVVEAINGELIFNMANQNIPELRVSREYVDMFDDYNKNKKNTSTEQKDALIFVKQKLDSARWFIDAVRQRQNTLRDTMLAIIEFQKDFFLSGEESDLKPMILKDVADLSGYDISTISRVSNSKYVQTNYGTFPLKYFFSEGLINEAGEEVSTREVKAILKESIEEEDKSKPLTDDALVKVLKDKGYEVARRTIAKYREQLGIPVARMRKEI